MAKKIFSLSLILLLLLSLFNSVLAKTQLEYFTDYYQKDEEYHKVYIEVWEYNVQKDGTLTSGRPRGDLDQTYDEPHSFDANNICEKCGYPRVFEAEVELTETLGIVDISQTVAVFNYFYDKTAKKYSVPMQTEVKQLGIDSYVRVKLNAHRTVRATGEEEDIPWDFVECGILDADGNLVEEGSTDYVIIGDYVYYTKVLPKGYTFYVAYYGRFASYQQLYASSYVNTTPSADAIQGQNFYPDFTTDDPWNNVDIQAKEKDEVDNKAVINYQIIDGEDFGDLEATTDEEQLKDYLMPGDSVEMEVNLEIKGEEGYLYEVLHDVKILSSMAELANSVVENFSILLSVDGGEQQEVYNDDLLEEKQSLGQYVMGQVLNLWYRFTLVEELDNDFESEEITVKAHYDYLIAATPTPSPTPTPTPSPTPAPTPTPSPTPIPTPTPTPSPSPTPTPTPTFTPTPSQSPTPTLIPTPSPTPVITSTPTIEPTNTPTPTIKPTHTPFLKPVIEPTATASPTPTPTPIPTISPEKIEEVRKWVKENPGKPIRPNFSELTDEELEELLEILDYNVPLYGQLLSTGDEIPSLVFTSLGSGLIALAIAILIKKKT